MSRDTRSAPLLFLGLLVLGACPSADIQQARMLRVRLGTPPGGRGGEAAADGAMNIGTCSTPAPPCPLQRGVCAGAVATRCSEEGWRACAPEDYERWNELYREEGDTRCDGLDNDCDGTADEDGTCAVCGDGVCAPAEGLETCPCDCAVCGDGRCTECREDAEACPADCCEATAVDDASCDGVDDDCDGATDEDATCDDGNPCTADTCDRACRHELLVRGSSCSDGRGCNGQEICVGGECVSQPAPRCDDGVPCTVDRCLPGAGSSHRCDHRVSPGWCHIEGACVAQGPWTEAPCLACMPEVDPLGWSYVGDGVSCTDDDPCTEDETCTRGLCRGRPETECDDGNPCTVDWCAGEVEGAACVHSSSAANGRSCDAGDEDGVCAEGVCASGSTAPAQEDEPACGDGVCDLDETCETCRGDCGPCSGVCGDGVCAGAETMASCPKDCGPHGFAWVPWGVFTMGSPTTEWGRRDDEGPQRRVHITKAFWMKRTEVTQGEWRARMGNNPSWFSSCGDDCPVEQVSWWEALAYCNALSADEGFAPCYSLVGCDARPPGRGMECADVSVNVVYGGATFCEGYRLPTEAEWELAYRVGDPSPYYNGDQPDRLEEIAWYRGNSLGTPHEVAELAPNVLRIYDLSGNVWEWVWDRYDRDSYSARLGPYTDPLGPDEGALRANRGGGWDVAAGQCRAATRGWAQAEESSSSLGLRPVRTVPP